mmetsp:Transcript_4274/g.10413  ORF Transcript_4274/g.10413 Transcript_4274/m.10413 type:complete len:208 (+) Transcript_4274:176-799(+)
MLASSSNSRFLECMVVSSVPPPPWSPFSNPTYSPPDDVRLSSRKSEARLRLESTFLIGETRSDVGRVRLAGGGLPLPGICFVFPPPASDVGGGKAEDAEVVPFALPGGPRRESSNCLLDCRISASSSSEGDVKVLAVVGKVYGSTSGDHVGLELEAVALLKPGKSSVSPPPSRDRRGSAVPVALRGMYLPSPLPNPDNREVSCSFCV